MSSLLDKETPGLKNWLHFARKFGISKEECACLEPKGIPSPTKKLMEYIVQVNPDLTLKQFIQTLLKLQRRDVVNALEKFLCGKIIFEFVRQLKKTPHTLIEAKLTLLFVRVNLPSELLNYDANCKLSLRTT